MAAAAGGMTVHRAAGQESHASELAAGLAAPFAAAIAADAAVPGVPRVQVACHFVVRPDRQTERQTGVA